MESIDGLLQLTRKAIEINQTKNYCIDVSFTDRYAEIRIYNKDEVSPIFSESVSYNSDENLSIVEAAVYGIADTGKFVAPVREEL